MEREEVVTSATGKLGVHFHASDSASRLNKAQAAGRLLAAICDELRRWAAQTVDRLWFHSGMMPKSCIPGRAHRLWAVTKLLLLMFLTGGVSAFRAAADGNTWHWTGNASAYWSNTNNWSPVGVPQSYDYVYFDQDNDNNRSSYNDLIDLTLVSLQFDKHDHQLDGNAINIDADSIGGDLTSLSGGGNSSFTTTINCPLILTSDLYGEVDINSFPPFGEITESTSTFNLNGPITVSGTVDVTAWHSDSGGGGNTHVYISGVVSGTGVMSLYAGGGSHVSTIELNGTPGNTFTGTTIVGDGITFNKQSGVAITGNLEAGDGGGGEPATHTVNLGSAGQISPGATITVINGVTLAFVGNDLTAANLVFTNYSYDVQPATLDTGTGSLTLSSNITAYSDNDHASSIIKGRVVLSSGAHTFDINNSAYAGLDMQAQVGGSGGFTKIGNAALLLEASNTLSGVIQANAGVLDVYNANGLGTTAGQTILGGSGSLTLRGISVAGEQLTVQGQSQVSPDTAGSLLTTIGSCTWSGPIVLNTNLVVLADDTHFTGQITGTGGLEFLGGNAQLIGTAANTFTGTTRVENNLLQFNNSPGVAAFSGPLIVGSSAGGGPWQAEWLNNLQGVTPAVTVYAGGLVNLAGHNENFGPVNFYGGDIETGNGLLTLSQTVTSFPVSSTGTLNGNVSISGGNLTFNIADGAAHPDLSVGAIISDASTASLTKQGFGELALSAANTYRGSTFVQGGVLMALNDAALGSATVGTTVSDGATLEVDGLSQNFAEGLQLSGAGRGGTNGALYCLSSSTISSAIFLAAPATIRSDETGSEFLLLSTITGTGPLTTTGIGKINLGGSADNTYTGDTLASQGTLWLSKDKVISKGVNKYYAIPNNLVIGTRTSQNLFGTTATAVSLQPYQINGSLVTVNGGSLFDLNNNYESIDEVILNSGGNVQTGAGSLLLNGVGGTVVSVNPGQSAASLITGHLNLNTGGTFSVGSVEVIPLSGAPPLDIQASISQTSPGDLTKTGPGEMRLSVSNSFTGNVFINQGVLSISNNFALGTTAGGTTVNSNATLELMNGLTITNEALTLNNPNPTAVLSASGSNVWSGSITLSQTAGIDVEPAGGYFQALNSVAGPGGLTKLGPGTLQFWGSTSNSYAGVTIVSNGVVEGGRVSLVSIPGNVIIGDDSTTNTVATLRSLRDAQINRAANITVRSSGELSLSFISGASQPNEHVASLNGEGLLSLANGSRLIVTNEVPCEFFGPVTGLGSFSKNGSASMTVWGNWNVSPFGSIDVLEGDFVVNGTITSSTNAVYSGGRLRGGGRLIGPVGVASGGAIGANSKAPDQQGGALEMNSLNLHSGATADLDFYGPSPTGGNDQFIVDGTVALNPANLSAAFHYPPHEGDVITLLNKTTSGAYSVFFNLGNGLHKIGDYYVLASYSGGDGNDLIITVTNAPLDYFSYRLAEGNGNQTVEPNECDLLYVSLVNLRTSSLTITNAILRATNASGVVVTIPQATYPVIPAGQSLENLTPFQFRTDTNLPCAGPVGFELVLGVANEGQYAINFSPVSGTDCTHPTGPCQSCNVASGQFTTNTPATLLPLLFTGAPSICYPGKAYPGTNTAANLPPTPFLTHSFTNSTTNQLCITAQLDFGCPTAPTNALGVAAYLGAFDTNNPATGYLGDGGAGGPPYPAFSFQVPAGTNFTLVVMAQATNLTCNNYTLELFGLPCAPPVLAIANELAPAKVRVDWSTAYPGFTAQQAGTPGGTYSNLTQTPVILNSRYALTNISATTNQFYRLKK